MSMIRILTVKGRDLNKLIPACIKQCRNLSHELLYREYGEPEAVLRLENCSYPNDISSDDVEVDWLAVRRFPHTSTQYTYQEASAINLIFIHTTLHIQMCTAGSCQSLRYQPDPREVRHQAAAACRAGE